MQISLRVSQTAYFLSICLPPLRYWFSQLSYSLGHLTYERKSTKQIENQKEWAVMKYGKVFQLFIGLFIVHWNAKKKRIEPKIRR